MTWEELPDYWGYVEMTYYEMRIEDGVSHEDAFAEWDSHARMKAAVPPQQPGESHLDYLHRAAYAELNGVILEPNVQSPAKKKPVLAVVKKTTKKHAKAKRKG